MQKIYVEEALIDHPRVKRILNRFTSKSIITCHHYGEVFNRKNQNFRQQKQKPALILAEKKGSRVLPSPEGFGIDGNQNYYFSHMLNCPFDCRYCFLQGLYRSAHYVLFVNYEDFMSEIKATVIKHSTPCTFFSGYDADSLAYDPVSQFTAEFVPFFKKHPSAYLELRTKAANVSPLLKQTASKNIIVAFTFTPECISNEVEHKVPSIEKRLNAMKQVADHGYSIGIRLDPLIYADNFKEIYFNLIDRIFSVVSPDQLHSVSVGTLRFPKKMFETIRKNYPHDKLINQPFVKSDKIISYTPEKQKQMEAIVRSQLSRYLCHSKIFSCSST